jgi:hypothetical protein
VKRYDSLPNAGITECPEGRFVKYKTAVALLKALERAAAALERADFTRACDKADQAIRDAYMEGEE